MTLVVVAAVSLGAATSLSLRPIGGGRTRVVLYGAAPRAGGAAVVTAGAIAVVTLGPLPVVLLAAAIWPALRLHTMVERRRDARLAGHAVPALCARLAAELRSGRPPLEALALAARSVPGVIAAAVARAATVGRLGGPVAEALTTGDCGAALAPVAACWSVAVAAGASLATALDGVGAALATDRDHRRALDAELAAPRLTGWLLGGLPLLGFAAAALLGSRPLAVLFGTPLGVTCLVVGLALNAVGVAWLRALARRSS